MIINKVTRGEVVQMYDDETNEFISQTFIPDPEDSKWNNPLIFGYLGYEFNPKEYFKNIPEPQLEFDMIQPKPKLNV